MTDLVLHSASVEIDQAAILRSLNLNPSDPKTQALLLVCDRYNLDPVLRHMVLISGNPYVTRDGYLHIAHMSGQFDGMEVLDAGETDAHWWAKVAVYRKDMSRPFAYIGRYPKAGSHMAKYGPEMAIKCAEVMALRRAFDVTGVGAADEQWDVVETTAVDVGPAAEAADQAAVQVLVDRMNALDHEAKLACKQGFVARFGHPSGLTIDQMGEAAEHVAAFEPDDRPTAPDLAPDDEPVDAEIIDDDPDGPSQQMTEHQRRKLHALLRAKRAAVGPDRMPVLSDLVGRDITSTNDLTPAEAAQVIDVLAQEPDLYQQEEHDDDAF